MMINDSCRATAAPTNEKPASMQVTVCGLYDEAIIARNQAVQLMVTLFGGEAPVFNDDGREMNCVQDMLQACTNILRQTLDFQHAALRSVEGEQ